jgi:hypothetical protein
MKKLVIYQENNEPIVLFDKDDIAIEAYCEIVNDVFHSQTISTIHTTEGSLILRPGKLLSISVQDILIEEPEMNNVKVPNGPISPPGKKRRKNKPKVKLEKEEIDIIKDADI